MNPPEGVKGQSVSYFQKCFPSNSLCSKEGHHHRDRFNLLSEFIPIALEPQMFNKGVEFGFGFYNLFKNSTYQIRFNCYTKVAF